MRIVRRSRRLSNQTPPDPLDPYLPGGFDYLDIPYPATEPLTQHPVATTVTRDPLPSSQTIECLSAFADQRELTPPDLHSQSRGRKGKNGNPPRPPNAFMLFRSDFWKFNKGTIPVRDHRQISRLAAHCWNVLDEPRRDPYQELARQLKDEHSQLYPQHRYNLPVKERASKKGKKAGIDNNSSCGVVAAQVAQDVRAPKSPNTPGSSEGGLFDQVVEQKVNLKRSRSASAVPVVEGVSKGESQPSQPPAKKRKRNLRKPSIVITPVSVILPPADPSHSSTPPLVPTNESPVLILPSSRDSPAVKMEPFRDPVPEFAAYTVAVEKEPISSPPPMAATPKLQPSEFEVPRLPASVSPPFDYEQPLEYLLTDPVSMGLRISENYGLSGPTEGPDFTIFEYPLELEIGSVPSELGSFAEWIATR